MSSNIILMYLRKSRQDLDAETVEETLARHENTLQEYAVRKWGKRIPEECIYREVVSGETIEARPMIQKLMSKMEDPNVSGVLVIEPQRLSRGDLIDCGTISNIFRYTNTICYTPIMAYDMNLKHERKFFEAELMRGGEYLEYIKEILQRGRIASVKSGNYIGSIPPYGYKKIKIGTRKQDIKYTLEIVEEEAAAIRLMYDVYVNQNQSFDIVQNELVKMGYKPRNGKNWSTSTIKTIIENPVYIGKLRWNWRKHEKNFEDGTLVKKRIQAPEGEYLLVDGLHPPIIDEDTYYAALARRGTNVRVKNRAKCVNPFAGLIRCSSCGKVLIYRNARGTQKPRLSCPQRKYCDCRSCTYDDFEQYIISSLQENIQQFQVELERLRSGNRQDIVNARIKQLEKELIEIDATQEEQYDLLESKIYTREIFLKRNKQLQERKQMTLNTIAELKKDNNEEIKYEQKIADFTAALKALQSDEYEAVQKNMLLKKCIQRIDYYRPLGKLHDNVPFTCTITLNV